MKKRTKIIISLLLVLTVLCATTVSFYAELVLNYSGYLYTYINNELVSIYGIEEGMTEASFPAVINTRKVVDIRNNAFYNNSELESVVFSNASNLERIGSFAFASCSKLSGIIVVPQSVEIIETAAFQECTSLTQIEFNSVASNIPSQCCYGCTDLESVVFNDYITAIDGYAFANCSKLSYVEIPSSVTAIAQTAFDGDTITLGVYTDSAAHQFAVNNDIPFILLDAPVIPTEPPTEAPTEAPTEPIIPTEEPTQTPTAEPTQSVTEAPTEAPVAILGDVDGDGNVSTIDATVMQRYLASVAYPDYCNFTYGDVDGDGTITILDVTYIMRYLASIDVPYPINKPIHNQ